MPERHVVETIVFTIASLLVILYLQHGDNDNSIKKSTTKRRQQRQKSPSILMKLITLFIFTSQLCYKGRLKILEMLAPCQILWCLAMALHYYPNLSASKVECIVQVFITWIVLPISAIANPDTSNCLAFGETTMFYVHHSVLIFIPLYYVFTGRISAVSSDGAGGNFKTLVIFNINNWLMGSAFKVLFYFSIISFINVWSGKNINYMMSPPPGMDVVSGENFRLFTILYLGILFMVGRGLVVALELLFKRNRNDNQKDSAQKDV